MQQDELKITCENSVKDYVALKLDTPMFFFHSLICHKGEKKKWIRMGGAVICCSHLFSLPPQLCSEWQRLRMEAGQSFPNSARRQGFQWSLWQELSSFKKKERKQKRTVNQPPCHGAAVLEQVLPWTNQPSKGWLLLQSNEAHAASLGAGNVLCGWE